MKKTELVVIDSKTNQMRRFVGKNVTHHVTADGALDPETVEIFRRNPDFLLDIDDPEPECA